MAQSRDRYLLEVVVFIFTSADILYAQKTILKGGSKMDTVFDSEILSIWKESFFLEHKDAEAELRETEGAISNERLWLSGSADVEEAEMHEQNIASLTEYASFLKDQLIPVVAA